MKNKKLEAKTSQMKTLTYKTMNFTVTKVKDASGAIFIEGFANTNDRDRVQEVVLPKAFEGSLPVYMNNPVLLYQHNWDMPIGVVEKAEVQEKGLFIKAKISVASDVSDIRTKISEGILKTFSIGYNEIRTEFDERTETKFIHELELLEISIVTIPANPNATFTVSAGDTATTTSQEEEGKNIQSSKQKENNAMTEQEKKAAAEAAAKKKEAEAAAAAAAAAKSDEETETPPPADGATPPKGEGDMLKVIEKLDAVVTAITALDAKITAMGAMLEEIKACGKPSNEEGKGAEAGQEKPVDQLTDEEAAAELEKVTAQLSENN